MFNQFTKQSTPGAEYHQVDKSDTCDWRGEGLRLGGVDTTPRWKRLGLGLVEGEDFFQLPKPPGVETFKKKLGGSLPTGKIGLVESVGRLLGCKMFFLCLMYFV